MGRGSFGACFGRAALERAGEAGATFAGGATDTFFARVLAAGLAAGLATALDFGLAFLIGVGRVFAERDATFAAFPVPGRPVALAFTPLRPTAVLAARVPDFGRALVTARAVARPDAFPVVFDFVRDAVAFGDRRAPRFAMMEILSEP